MTNGFSIGEAMVTPVRVIRRHPLSVFVWGFVMTAFTLAAFALMFGTLAGLPLEPGAEPPPEVMSQFMAMQGLSMLLNVGQLVLGVMIWAATMRATLMIGRPEKFCFLRLGMDELRLVVVGIALFLGAYVAVLILVVLGAVICAILWQASEPTAVIVGVLLTLALFVVVAVAMARLSLIAPATMILKQFAFVEGWRLGKKRTLPLLGLLISTWLIYMVVYSLLGLAVFLILIFGGAFAGFGQGEMPATLGEMFPATGALWAAAAVILLPGSFVYGAVMTLLCAPFASACRQLLDSAPQDAASTIG